MDITNKLRSTILQLLIYKGRLTVSDISKEVGISPLEAITELLALERSRALNQLNGYWSVNHTENFDKKISRQISRHISDLVKKWGALSSPEISYILNVNESVAVYHLKEIVNRGELIRTRGASGFIYKCLSN